MQRLLTAALALPLVALALFKLEGLWFLILVLALVEIAVVEYVRLARAGGGGRAVLALPVLVPPAAFALGYEGSLEALSPPTAALLAAFLMSGVLGLVVLFSRGPLDSALYDLGISSFGLGFFAVAAASLYRLHEIDPWVLFLLLALVFVGDTAAYYLGTMFGRRRLAPATSPKKTWVGAAASLVSALLVAWLWARWRLEGASLGFLAVCTLTAVAAQLGDLIESMIKRSVKVKDSGALLPGHGGMFDRLDALLLAAPVLVLLLEVFALESLTR